MKTELTRAEMVALAAVANARNGLDGKTAATLKLSNVTLGRLARKGLIRKALQRAGFSKEVWMLT